MKIQKRREAGLYDTTRAASPSIASVPATPTRRHFHPYDYTAEELQKIAIYDDNLTDLSDDASTVKAGGGTTGRNGDMHNGGLAPPRVPMGADADRIEQWVVSLPVWHGEVASRSTESTPVNGRADDHSSSVADCEDFDDGATDVTMESEQFLGARTVSMRSIPTCSDITMLTFSTTRTLRAGLGAVDLGPDMDDDAMSIVSSRTILAPVISGTAIYTAPTPVPQTSTLAAQASTPTSSAVGVAGGGTSPSPRKRAKRT